MSQEDNPIPEPERVYEQPKVNKPRDSQEEIPELDPRF